MAGTAAAPTQIICGDDAAEPPSTSATTATVSTTGTSNITFTGANYYVYGITFNVGTGAGSCSAVLGPNSNGRCWFEQCHFNLVTSSGSAAVQVGGTSGNCEWRNVWVKFAQSGQRVTVQSLQNARLVWNGGGLTSGGTSPTALVGIAYGEALLSGLDISAASAGIHVFSLAANTSTRGTIRNSRLPTSWSGSLVTGTLSTGCRFELYNCDSADTNYRLQIRDYAGNIDQETVVVRSSGASDGVTPLSWKLVSSANAEFPHTVLDTPEIVQWNDSVGSSLTVTVEVVTDNVTLTNAECWLEIQYLGTSGVPLGSYLSDVKSDMLGSATNQDSSSVTWTTTGLGTPVKQYLRVTFTPQEKGFVHAVVKLAKASTTVYVDPLLTIA